MCGLIGSFNKNGFTLPLIKATKNMLYADALRGHHSTGIFVSQTDKTSKLVSNATLKLAGTAIEAMSNNAESFAELINHKTTLLLGHNRYATLGGISTETAHPFTHGDVTLAHNGTLHEHRSLTTQFFTVDSEAICSAISQVEPEDAHTVLTKLRGAYALQWFDARDNSLNFARNSQRPLHFAVTATGGLSWASEEKMLDWCLDRNNITTVSTRELPVQEHHKFLLEDMLVNAPIIQKVAYPVYKEYPRPNWGAGRQSYGSTYQPQGSKVGTQVGEKTKAETEGNSLGYYKGDLIKLEMTMFTATSSFSQLTGKYEGNTLDFSKAKIIAWGSPKGRFFVNGKPDYARILNLTYVWDIGLQESVLTVVVDPRTLVSKSQYEEQEASHTLALLPEELGEEEDTEISVLLADGTIIEEEKAIRLSQQGCSMCASPIGLDEIETATPTEDENALICRGCIDIYNTYFNGALS